MKEAETTVSLEMNKSTGGTNVALIRGDIKTSVW